MSALLLSLCIRLSPIRSPLPCIHHHLAAVSLSVILRTPRMDGKGISSPRPDQHDRDRAILLSAAPLTSRERRGPPRQLSEAELGLGVPGRTPAGSHLAMGRQLATRCFITMHYVSEQDRPVVERRGSPCWRCSTILRGQPSYGAHCRWASGSGKTRFRERIGMGRFGVQYPAMGGERGTHPANR